MKNWPQVDGAVGVQALVAGHLQLGAEEERGVRIDQQQRVVRRRCSTARSAMPFDPVGSVGASASGRRGRAG